MPAWATVSRATVSGIALASALVPVGQWGFGDDSLTRIAHNTLWSQVSNLYSIPTDCPQRDEVSDGVDMSFVTSVTCMLGVADDDVQCGFHVLYRVLQRLGWLADAHMSMEGSVRMFNGAAFYRQFIRSIIASENALCVRRDHHFFCARLLPVYTVVCLAQCRAGVLP